MFTQKNVLLVAGLVVLWWLTRFGLSSNDTIPNDSSWGLVADSPSKNNGPREIITVGHNGSSLVPSQVVLEEGKSYDVQITPTANGIGCMYAATVPTLSSEVWNIKAGETFTIQIDNAKSGTYPVVCTSMGMRQWEIVVQS